MASKKERKKSPPLFLFAEFDDTDKPPEPSPSFFTEVPVNYSGAGEPSEGAPGKSGRSSGVKLYFRPGLGTEAIVEGLQQALRHECTVLEIDLGCALQVNWEVLAEPLLRHLVAESLVSVQVPSLKVMVAKGKCKGTLLDLLRQQLGNYVTIYGQKFRIHQVLNTDLIIGKIKPVDDVFKKDQVRADKIRNVIKTLNELIEPEWKDSALFESQEFRVAMIKVSKMVKKKAKLEKRTKRTLDIFKELCDEDEVVNEKDGPPEPKRRRRKHKLPALNNTFSDESSASEMDLGEFISTDDTSTAKKESVTSPGTDDHPPSPSPAAVSSLDQMTRSTENKGTSSATEPTPAEPTKSSDLSADGAPSQLQTPTKSLSPSPTSSTKGQVNKCYVCRQRFYTASKKRTTPATKHYVRMCIPCAEFNWKKRHQTNDLSGMVAVVTGGRIKIGYHIVLKLLRCGCKVIATTRFPHDATKVYAQEEDYKTWADRLTIYPLDLKNADGIYKFINYLKQTLDKLDILINNAAQTIHRPVEFYRHLLDYEQISTHTLPEEQQRLLVGGINLNKALTPGDGTASQPKESIGAAEQNCSSSDEDQVKRDNSVNLPDDNSAHKADASEARVFNPDSNSSLATNLAPPTQMKVAPPMRMSSFEREALFPTGRFDADGQQLDLRRTNTWRTVLDEVPVGELLEVMMVNTVAPFILDKELKDLMIKSKEPRKFIVNVSAMEGQFSRRAKTEFHPHTNMAKAALNMMTRTAALSYRQDNIFMTAVDTGWVTDERPFHMARHEERKGFVLPLDIVDGAARVVDPIMNGITSDTEPHYAVFLKDYRPYPW